MATVPISKKITRSTRLEARLLPEQRRRIERAAGHKGLSVSDFVVQAADEAAAKAIEQHEAWVLGEADRNAFMQALLNPREPSDRVKAAIKDYKQRVRQA